MAVIQYLDKRGLKTLVKEIKRHTSDVYTIKGGAIYADNDFLKFNKNGSGADVEDDGEKYDGINSNGLWQKQNGSWQKVEEVKVGWVYNVYNTFTTDSDFVEGAGNKVEGGTNIVVAKVGDEGNGHMETETGTIKWDLLAMSLNLDPYQTKRLVKELEVFKKGESGDAITVTAQSEAPTTDEPEDPEENDIVIIEDSDDGTDGDIWRYDGSSWKKIGDQVTVEGSLELLGNIAPNTPISDAEIIAAFDGE